VRERGDQFGRRDVVDSGRALRWRSVAGAAEQAKMRYPSATSIACESGASDRSDSVIRDQGPEPPDRVSPNEGNADGNA